MVSSILRNERSVFVDYVLCPDFTGNENCFNVKMSAVQYGSDAEWQLGACSSVGTKYDNHKKYIHRCCLKPGQHILTCINKRNPYGWGNSYIEIQGQRYCDDFMSYRLMQKIGIRGKNLKFKIFQDSLT